MLGVLNWFVSTRHVGQGWPGLPEANEPLAGQQGASTGVRAGDSERGSRRPGAASEQENQRGRAGSRSERAEEGASTHHGDPGAGLACPSGQIAPRSIHLLTGQGHGLLGRGLYQLLKWTLGHLVNPGHGHTPLATRGDWPVS